MLANVESVTDKIAERFVEAAGGDEAKIVVIIGQEKPLGEEEEKKLLAVWQSASPDSLEHVSIGTREQADDADTVKILHEATGFWLTQFDGPKLAALAGKTKLGGELRAALKRGDAIGIDGPAGERLGEDTFAKPSGKELVSGLNLLAGCLIDARSTNDADDRRLHDAVRDKPGRLGIALPKSATLEIRGRLMRPLGDATVSIVLPPGKNWTREQFTLSASRPGDWNQLHRAVHDRGDADYLPKSPAACEVEHGSLVIVGGGGMPPDILKKFIELGGGAEGRFVVFPTAMPDPVAIDAESRFIRRGGAKNVTVLPAREQAEVDSAENLETLKKATGIWFGGGRQWRFIDAYEGTKTAELLHNVLRHGGVIGGSSAGATIQGDYLVRGSPFGPDIMMCEGYERGLCFLPGVAIDQHFTARNRFADMTALMKKYPQFLGIGLDEATAIVVQGHTAEIMGKGKAHFYDRRKEVEPDKPDYEAGVAGDRFDLKARKLIAGEKKAADKGTTAAPHSK